MVATVKNNNNEKHYAITYYWPQKHRQPCRSMYDDIIMSYKIYVGLIEVILRYSL